MGLQKGLCDVWKKEHQQYYCNLDWKKSGGLIPWNATENSIWKAIRRIILSTNNSVWSNGRIPSDINTRSIKTSSTWQASLTRHFPWVCIHRGWNLERRCCDCGPARTGDSGRFRDWPSKDQRKRSLDYSEGIKIKFPVADGTAKLFGSCEFPEPTLRREQTERSAGLSGDLRGESEESQPTEPKDDWLKHAEIFGLFMVTSSIVIVEFKCMCRKKKHSRSRCNISM